MSHLPQLSGDLFLTDGGLETTLIFHEGWEMPQFAAFQLLANSKGEEALRRYFRTYAEIARHFGTGLILESVTWRASADWGTKLGYTEAQLRAANEHAINMLRDIRAEYSDVPTVISGCVGPRGDGYVPGAMMTAREAEAYHSAQIGTLASALVDMVAGFTLNYTEEAIGIVRAAEKRAVPVAISFTVETDGNLPTGEPLRSAIERTDEATCGYPEYYMINCAHPLHFAEVLEPGDDWTERIRGIRANSSCRSHAELNDSPDLDPGDPDDLGRRYADIVSWLPHVNILGGCCGTDHRHVEAIAAACAPRFRRAAAA